MNKIFKWFMWALIIVGLVILVMGTTKGFPGSPAEDNGTVDPLLYWAYAMLGIAIFCVIVVGIVISVVNNPKSLIKLCAGIVAVAAICFVVYSISKGAPALNLTTEQPSQGTLKLTDTVLNLTYLAGGCAILSIVFGELIGAVLNRK